MLRVYAPLKYALGIDKGMMLRIQISAPKEDRLEIAKRAKVSGNSKTMRKSYPVEHEGESTGLKVLIADVLAWRKDMLKSRISPWLFCASRGDAKGNPPINVSGR